MRRSLVFVLAFSLLSFNGLANVQERVKEATGYTVRVEVANGDVFSSQVSEGHGTGFIVETDRRKGVIWTNKHVIQRTPYNAQKIEILFQALGPLKVERIAGRVVLKSPLIDFAVIEFDLSRLSAEMKRAIRVAEIPSVREAEELSIRGRAVAAMGNPLDTQSVLTLGNITNVHVTPWDGAFVQTSAAINPGNSGGPLIDVETGKIVGINTMKVTQAEGMGFAIPIAEAWHEYESLRAEPNYARRTFLPFVLAEAEIEQIEARHLLTIIQAAYPSEYIAQRYSSLYYVQIATRDSGLSPQDLLLTANGVFVGGHPYLLRHIVQRSKKKTVALEVLRGGEIVKVECPISNERGNGHPEEFEFAVISGALFLEKTGFEALTESGMESSVVLGGYFPGTLAPQHLHRFGGTRLESVTYGGREAKIRSMTDLREFLKTVPPNDRVTFYFLASMSARLGSPMGQIELQMPGRDRNRLHPVTFPVSFVLTNENVPFGEALEQFDFTGFQRPETRMGYLGLWAQYCKDGVAARAKKKS